MQFDSTSLAIRERSSADIFDLALVVLRTWFAPLASTFALVALPLALLNDYLLAGLLREMVDDEYALLRYLSGMAVLVFAEAPLASILSTPVLGQAVFRSRPPLAVVLRDTSRAGGALATCHLLVRGTGALVFWYLLARWIPAFDEAAWILCAILLLTWVALVRACRPFVNEILLLERSPLWAGRTGGVTAWRRSQKLQGDFVSELLARWLASLPVAFFLASLLAASLWFALSLFSSDWSLGPWCLRLGVPFILWLTALYLSVVRYLNYLDLRIRQEGWEVELRIRAEAERLRRSMV